MLIRAYRITDRLGIVVLKSSAALSSVLAEGIGTLFGAAQHGLGGILAIFSILLAVLAWFARLLTSFLRVVFGVGLRLSGRAHTSTVGAASGAMARRSARAEMEAGLAEDPLRAQNRVLSMLVVVVLVALISVVLWATSSTRSPDIPFIPDNPGLALAPDEPTPQNPQVASLNLATPVPTATDLPEVLQVRGSLAYVVRENGQTNIWAAPVDGRTQIRLTNSQGDDRDPAWSPDGLRLAYASNKDGNWDIYIYNLVTGETQRMTYSLAFEAAPQWSPDGEYIVYESYQTPSHIDIFVMRSDGSEAPIRLPASSDAPDLSPVWSPDHRLIAFSSWREGNRDIYIFDLNTQEVYNLTNTPTRHEDHPAWSPDGRLLAYSAVEAGIETIYVKRVDDPSAPAEAFRRGRTPSWSPDGNSIVLAVDASDSTHIFVAPYSGAGVTTEVIQAPLGASHPVWTASPLPSALVNSGGLELAVDSLYVEQVQSSGSDDPPYGFGTIINISGAEYAFLNERVNDSFNAMRVRANEKTGWDFLGQLSDAFWPLDHRPQLGEPRRNWHMAGRAFSINRNMIVGFPPPIEIVREDSDLATYWRIFVRVADNAQNGELGEPLRDMPWNFASATSGDVEAYDQGGRLRAQMPSGYYVDFTQLAQDYGWMRVPAGSDWRANFNARNYWTFEKRQGLQWYEAMRELYLESQLVNFAPTPTPAPVVNTESEDQG